MWFCAAAHELVCHAKQVAQDAWSYAPKPDQDCGVGDVMVRDVVNIRGFGQQRGAIGEIHPDCKRCGLSRPMHR